VNGQWPMVNRDFVNDFRQFSAIGQLFETDSLLCFKYLNNSGKRA
jgi:hypothetical protein